MPVWVEWRECGILQDGKPREAFLPQIRELTALLRDRDKSREFCAPTSAGYFHGIDNDVYGLGRLGLVFEIPLGLSGLVEPVSLYQLFNDKEIPSTLECSSLAHAVSSCLVYLHAACWFHKGFSSYATIFFRDASDRVNLKKSFLSGFDYSRPARNEEMMEKPRFDPYNDFYRHPRTQGNSPPNYWRIWDIYGLGIVLVEIAPWQPIHLILGHKNPSAIKATQIVKTHERLLRDKSIL
jgi:hypothetical protein